MRGQGGPKRAFRIGSALIVAALLLAIFSGQGAARAQSTAGSTARVALFHSPACGHCRTVLEEVLPPLTQVYQERLEIRFYDVSVSGNADAYALAHQMFPDLPNAVPLALIGDAALVGSDQIANYLPGLIERCLAQGGCDWPIPVPPVAISEAPLPRPAQAEAVLASMPDDAVYLAYFYDPSCIACEQVSADLVALQDEFPNLTVRRYDITHEAALNESLCERYGVAEQYRLSAPMIFVGDEALLYDEIDQDALRQLIEEQCGAPPPWEAINDAAEAEGRILRRFRGLSLLTVIGAGLLDGINPCAFTTLIFFTSYLALVGRKGKDVLLVGGAFTAAVFLTYLALGLGLSEIVRGLGATATLIGRLIYVGMALVCVTLAALSLADYIKIRQGRLKEIALQLPAPLKKRIHRTIRERSRVSGYIGAAFVTGILVSLFELACTGQVYMPTILFVSRIASLRSASMVYLVIYNFMFVAPLVVVFAVTYLGTSSQQITRFFEGNVGLTKLLTALLFAGLGVWLLIMAIG